MGYVLAVTFMFAKVLPCFAGVGRLGYGSAFLDGPLEGQGAVPRPSGGQKSGDGRGVRHGIPVLTLSVLKVHY